VFAALEPYGDAMLASSASDAVAGVEHLKHSGGRGAFVVGGVQGDLPEGVRSIREVVADAPPDVLALLSGVAIAPSFAEAVGLVREHPSLVVVTPDGDRVSSAVVAGGSAEALGADLQQTLASVSVTLEEQERELSKMHERASHARRESGATGAEVEALAARANELDAEITGATERMTSHERDDHAAEREDGVLAGRISEVTERLGRDSEKLAAVEARLGRVVAEEHPAQDPSVLAAIERRAAERSLRLGTLTERERAAGARLADLRARAIAVADAHAAWERSRFTWAAAAERAGHIAAAAATTRERIETWCAEAREGRAAHDARRADLDGDLAHLRRRRREAEARFAEVREETHRTELARAERSHRLASLTERIQADYGSAPDQALAAADAAAASDETDIEELRRRASTLERRLGLLGRVNPIAMEQYSGLVDRHAFLTEQVNDLKKSRRDLVSVVEEVDGKIREVFTEAFSDVAREFATVFGRMFPGGEGKLTLTDADPLIAGVEVEARPGGKRVKRISLLSGGERSLVALALLYAIFRARPSPFYLLDEVEPALDDVNLVRFLELTAEFKEASQIIIVTHQKRTMEIADVLYGISMASDGVTRVISQALEEPQPVA
jgi:chromosome segregation protein